MVSARSYGPDRIDVYVDNWGIHGSAFVARIPQ